MIRTDLALEAREMAESAEKTTKLPGVRARESYRRGTRITRLEILNETGERKLGKPVGCYVTLELEAVRRKEREALTDASEQLCRELQRLSNLQALQSVLVVGLGNPAVTPDALGPMAAKRLLVTRHLIRQLPEQFGAMRAVSVVEPGVLGVTGLESGELVAAAVERVRPDAVIALDALAAGSLERLFLTVQLSDAGIVPGSGVGNARQALSQRTLGVPVYSVGVPTVVDAATLVEEQTGVRPERLRGMVVTSKDVDAALRRCVRIVSEGLNRFLHPELSQEELQWLLSDEVM